MTSMSKGHALQALPLLQRQTCFRRKIAPANNRKQPRFCAFAQWQCIGGSKNSRSIMQLDPVSNKESSSKVPADAQPELSVQSYARPRPRPARIAGAF